MRTASLPAGGALVKETGDKRPLSAHSILNSVTRHSSLKTKVTSYCIFNDLIWGIDCFIKTDKHLTGAIMNIQVESPQLRKTTTAGRSKSFSNHRTLEPEVISQVEHSSQVLVSVQFLPAALHTCLFKVSPSFVAGHRDGDELYSE